MTRIGRAGPGPPVTGQTHRERGSCSFECPTLWRYDSTHSGALIWRYEKPVEWVNVGAKIEALPNPTPETGQVIPHRVLGDHGHSLMRAVADVDQALEATH